MVLKYHGGKSHIASKIIAMMPEHTRYVEPYAGGMSVLLRKPCEGISEFANDLNGGLTNFWNVLASPDAFFRFHRIAQCIPLSEVVFKQAEDLSSLISTIDQRVAWALAFFVRMRMSRQGLGKDFCTATSRTRRGMNENVSAWLSAVDGLPEIHERLRRVQILRRPAVDVIKGLDSESTLFYCDPPYLHETRSSRGEYGSHEMTAADHIELLECLADVQGKFLLSGYKSTLYLQAEREHGWTRREIEVANSASSAKTKERKIECVWSNG